VTHAYVAKAAAAAASFDGPTGWRITWPWPGAYPPGYAPSYSFIFDGPTSVKWDDTASEIEAKLQDQLNWRTKEPESDITWTAYIGDEEEGAVQLKVSGDPDWSVSITRSFQQDGADNWYDDPTLLFQLSESDVGSTLSVKVSCTMDDETISDVHQMTIVADHVWTAEYKCTMPATSLPEPPSDEYVYGIRLYGHDDTSLWTVPWGYVTALQYRNLATAYWAYDDGANPFSPMTDFGIGTPSTDAHAWIYEVTDTGTIYVKTFQIRTDVIYDFEYRVEETKIPWSNVQYNLSVKVYKNGKLYTQASDVITKNDGDPLGSITKFRSLNGSTKQLTS
jgi:hypothetical protein